MDETKESENDLVKNCLISLSHEAKELGIGTTVPKIDIGNISPLSFYRDYVSSNQPVVIHRGCGHWPALEKWCDSYLSNVLKEKVVNIAVTPNGYADAIATDNKTKADFFVMPEERNMTMSHFIEKLNHPEKFPGVYYLQRQNSNLVTELPELLGDVDAEIPWASEAFGQSPDAVNFWMGDHRAVTSLHKDPYENIYCVVRGFKDFILFPPTDLPWIPYNRYPIASYMEKFPGVFDLIPRKQESKILSEDARLGGSEHVLDDDYYNEVPWISIDPLHPDVNKYPLFRHASPLHVRVQAGDILFLPSLWFHHVRQSHKCVAVNYWYDMQYDVKYAYHKFLESVSKIIV